MVLVEIILTEDVAVPVLVSVLTLMIGGGVLWLIRMVSKITTHVLPHFDPGRQAEGSRTLPTLAADLEQRLDRHLADEEGQNRRTAEAIEGLRGDIDGVHRRIDDVLGPGNPEVRRG